MCSPLHLCFRLQIFRTHSQRLRALTLLQATTYTSLDIPHAEERSDRLCSHMSKRLLPLDQALAVSHSGQAQDYQLCGHGATPGNTAQKQPPPCAWWVKTGVESRLPTQRFTHVKIQPIYCSFIGLHFTETDRNHTSLLISNLAVEKKKSYSKTQGRARSEEDGAVL